jgi:hypothetical protein
MRARYRTAAERATGPASYRALTQGARPAARRMLQRRASGVSRLNPRDRAHLDPASQVTISVSVSDLRSALD